MIIETTVTPASSGSTIVPDMPTAAQATGDVFLLVAANDGGNNPINVPDWLEIAGVAPNNFSRTSCWYIEHTGTDITAPTVSGTSNDWIVIVVLCRDFDVASIVDQAVRTDNAATTYDHEAATVTTTGTDELVFHIYGLDGGGYPSPSYGYGEKQIARVELVNNLSLNVDVINAPTAGVLPAAAYNTGVSGMASASARRSTLYTIAFNTLPDADIEPIANCKPAIIWDYSREPTTYNVTTLHATLLGKPTSNVSISSVSRLTAYSQDLTWYGGYTQYLVSTPASLSVQILCKDIPSTDMSVYPYSITFGNSLTFRHSDDGPLFYFRDGSGNWALWQPITKDQLGNVVLRTVIGKMSDQTFVDSGGTIDWSDIVVTGSGQDIVSTSVSTQRWFIACEAVMTPAIVTGGNDENPANPKLIADSFATGVSIYRKISQGSGQDLLAASVELGNLTTKTHFIASLDSSAYPEDGSDVLIGYNCGEDTHSYTVKASADDIYDFRSWILRSSDKQSFAIDPSSSTSATYLTDTWIVSGYDVTWKTGIPCDGVSFVGCGIIDAKGASFVGGRVIDSISTTHSMTATDGAAIGYDFTKGAETYAIELSSVGGTYDLSQATFNGYTTELNITAATGTTTITLALGQDEPSYDAAGATVVFATPVIEGLASITNMVVGSRLEIINETKGTKPYNDIVATSSFSDTYVDGTTYSNGDLITIRINYFSTITAKKEFSQSVIATSNGWSFLAEQVDDPVYNSIGLDGGIITKFMADYINDEVDLVVGADFSGAEFYAWWVANGSTEQGIDEFFGGVTAVDEANLRINDSIVDMYFDNTTEANLKQTDNRRIYREDGAYPVKNPTTGGGGIDIVWRNQIFVAGLDKVVDILEADEEIRNATYRKLQKTTKTPLVTKNVIRSGNDIDLVEP